MNERLSDSNNFNTLFQRICALSVAYDKKSPKKYLETRATIGSIVGGSILGEILEQAPNLKRIMKSKSGLKWRLGSWGGNVEVYSSPAGIKLFLITNGYSRKDKRNFKVEQIIPVKKIQGIWVEWREKIPK